MGSQHLHGRLRIADIDDWRLGRSLRCEKNLHDWLCPIHDRFAYFWTGANIRNPDCRPRSAGVGAAIMVPNSLALLNHAYPGPKARGRAVGWWVGAGGVALTAGPPVGGALIALAGWRSIFLVNLPIGVAGLWLTWRYITDTPRASRKLDLPGQAAAIGALGILAAALIEGGRLGWSDSGVIAAFGAAAILAVLFLVHERRAEEPILPLSLFRRPMFARTSLIGLLVNIPFYGLIFVFSLYFQQIDGLSPLRTGLAFVPMMAVICRAICSRRAWPSDLAHRQSLRSGV
jgi:MFS transporter, DHA2 family, methylenomycin A resistance protein